MPPRVFISTPCTATPTPFALAFTPTATLASAARTRRSACGTWTPARRYRGAEASMGSPIWSLAFSHDGRLLASGSSGEHIHLWEVAQGDLLYRSASPRPYQDVTITDVHGLTAAQRCAA
ncbi:MAG: WD40 repeat domain-containing protein [Caldilineaceae bacterium]